MSTYPTHLSCPYCPAQAFPTGNRSWVAYNMKDIQKYECPSKHEFYASPEAKKEEPK